MTRTFTATALLLGEGIDRAQHGARLRTRLLELVRGLGVGDRAAAGLDVGDAVLDHDGADVDAGVEVAGVGQPADRAAVAAALDGLELVDDLHRAHLRRARQRARREDRAQRVHRADVPAQRARDVGDDVHDVRVGLHAHERVDLDGPVLADAAQVVAARGRRASRARRAPWGRRAGRRRSGRRPRASRRGAACRRSGASTRAGR